jgi:DNA-binding NarL/FixJ family response regulator
MLAVVRELRDPAALALALLTGAANLAIGVRPVLAVGAVIAVLAVRLVAGLAWPRPPAPIIQSSLDPAAEATSPLSRRELEVAALVSDGLSNREIGPRLFIAERTVDNHIQHIFNKLNFNSRAQIAAWYTRRRLDQK